MYITLFISTLHNIDDISFVLLYGSSRKNNTGQSELTEKKAMVPSAAANTC